MKNYLLLFLLILGEQTIYSQYQIGLIPRVSPDRGVSHKIGYTDIEIKYGSPAVKNRLIWGDVVPYGQVWRAGANNATTVEFSNDVIVKGKKLKAGKYSFFLIPDQNDKWIAIFNSQAKQWGAFRYDQSKDALRISVLPKRNKSFTEDLTYSINSHGFNTGEIILNWEYLEIRIELETDYANQFKMAVEQKAEAADKNIQWVTYLQGAEYLEQTNSNLDLAKEWINKSETNLKEVSEWNKQYYPKDYIEGHLHWVKAKLLARNGAYLAAIKAAEKMKGMQPKSLFYEREKEEENIDKLIKIWMENLE